MISILKRSFATVAKKSPKASALPTSQLMNSQIKYERILFINELGKSEGLMDLTLALSRTPHTHNLVLVNDSNKENPICRVITNEKLQPKEADVKRKAEVEEKKERREEQDKEDIMRKRHQDITKIMRCKTNISDHDLNIKIKKAIEMLEKGYKVCAGLFLFSVEFRGSGSLDEGC
jgi:translation initiation factor IF-3